MAGYPDLIKTLEQLKSFLNDPRIAELDSCFDLTKRKNAKFRKKCTKGICIQIYLNHTNYIYSEIPAICNDLEIP